MLKLTVSLLGRVAWNFELIWVSCWSSQGQAAGFEFMIVPCE